MSDFGNVRATVFRGEECIRVAIRRAPNGAEYVEVAKYSVTGIKLAALSLRLEELDRIAEGLRDARNVTLGHPRHEPAESPHGKLMKLKAASGDG